MFRDTQKLITLVKALSSEKSQLRMVYPVLTALVQDSSIRAVNEHGESGNYPLLDHAVKSLEILKKIEAIEFPEFPGSINASIEIHELLKSLDSAWISAIRQALIFMDVSKGGNEEQRRDWKKRGVDLSIHNFASAELAEFIELPANTILLIRWHGMIGQFARGEVSLRNYFHIPNSDSEFLRAYFILNLCDTAAVRDDLMTPDLLAMFGEAFKLLSGETPDRIYQQHEYNKDSRAQRFSNLRRSRGEKDIDKLFLLEISKLPNETQSRFIELFDGVNFWYCESALAGLSAPSHLKAIAFALGSAERAHATNPEGFDLSFHSLSLLLNAKEAEGRYRLRLLEATFASIELVELFNEGLPSEVLVGMDIHIGAQKAIQVDFGGKEEANALVTLLRIYETKSSAQFHVVLKMLCDLYGLRKDTFDRVANEQEYLKNMNSARSDKARMLDYVVPGTIVEVGPGGGVVLDLLSKRFTGSEVIGIDVSQEVVDALNERSVREKTRWEIRFGDAFELPHILPEGYDCVIFCSLLHEIFSYVVDPKSGKKFQHTSVANLLRAAYRGLKKGGRLVIRDGVAPPEGERIIRFLDPEGPNFLKLFAEQFEGIPINVDWVDVTTARLSSHAAMEFLYCYTWGPASFPYEVREQYGILNYEDYISQIEDWLEDEDIKARSEGRGNLTRKRVEIPKEHQSYLQPGYKKGLSSKVILLDENLNQVELPDSNCLIVFEKI